mgnify:CR=1 FL=1
MSAAGGLEFVSPTGTISEPVVSQRMFLATLGFKLSPVPPTSLIRTFCTESVPMTPESRVISSPLT